LIGGMIDEAIHASSYTTLNDDDYRWKLMIHTCTRSRSYTKTAYSIIRYKDKNKENETWLIIIS